VIDTVGNLLISLGVGLCPLLRMDLALIILAIYQMLALQVLVRAIVDREFHLAVGRMGPTEMRMGIASLNILLICFGRWSMPGLPRAVHWPDLVMALTIVGLLGLFFWQMAGHMGRFAKTAKSAKVRRGRACCPSARRDERHWPRRRNVKGEPAAEQHRATGAHFSSTPGSCDVIINAARSRGPEALPRTGGGSGSPTAVTSSTM
jgi:hypothetical protein